MRIVNLSKKYNERPSTILDIEDSIQAFFFDEAIDHILSMRGKREVERKGKKYIEEYWIKEPKWCDIAEVKKVKPSNNSTLIQEMEKELKKFK